MNSLIKRAVVYLVMVVSLWLLIFGLLAGALILQFKALILLLTPLLGAAWAYSISGLVCLGFIALTGFIAWIRIHTKVTGSLQQIGKVRPDSQEEIYESALLALKKYPLESVVLAFALGFSANDSAQMKKVLGDLLRES